MESKNNWKAWLYLAPVLILLAVFTFYPIIQTVLISFMKDYDYIDGNYSGFTFENYSRIFTLKTAKHEVLEVGLFNTMLLTFITVPLSIVISLAIAIGLNSIKIFKKFFQTIFFMPYVTNAIAIGMVFSVVFASDYGVFNNIFGLHNVSWIIPSEIVTGDKVNYWRALFAICFYIVWHSLPYKILIFLGGLQNIDAQYYDAAKIDSAPKWKVALKITVPLLSPQILYMMITSFIGAFKEYNSVIGLFGKTGGTFDKTTGPRSMRTMVFFIYDMVAQNKVHYASAASIFLFIIIMLFTLVQSKVSKRRVHY